MRMILLSPKNHQIIHEANNITTGEPTAGGKKRVLVCPLDWGLGHATRLIPMIDELRKNDQIQPVIAADNYAMQLLQSEFPDLEQIRFPSFTVRYAVKPFFILSIIFQVPKILFGIFLEHRRLRKIVADYGIDAIVSDNRYGLWHSKRYSVFITHQLRIKTNWKLSFVEKYLQKINYYFIKQYDTCLIPDYEKHGGLAGGLSHPERLPDNVRYIGILSRFENRFIEKKSHSPHQHYDILVVLSGIEPQRTIFERLIINQLVEAAFSALVIRGKPLAGKPPVYKTISNSVTLVSHLETVEFGQYLLKADMVICRSGYSSVMDLVALQCAAILVPTPGQTEQEYLAQYLKQKGWFYSVPQAQFNLKQDIVSAKAYKPPPVDFFQSNTLAKPLVHSRFFIHNFCNFL